VGQSVAATAGTIGVSSSLFGALPVAGFFLNIAVVPLCGLFMAEAFLFLGAWGVGLAAVRDAAAGAVDASGLLVLGVNAWGANLAAPWALRAVPPPLATAAGIAALLLAAGLREGARGAANAPARRGRAVAFGLVALAGVLPLLPWDALSRAEGRPFLLAIDVGQGDALLARLEDGSALLFDAGPSDDRRDAGRSAVEPALRAEGISRFRVAVLSHAHGDHFGGLAWLARRGWIGALLENGSDPRGAWRGPIERGVARSGGSVRRVSRDTTIVLAGGGLALRAPPPDSLIAASGNAAENDRSIVADLTLGGTSVHVPGDAEERAEAAAIGIEGRLTHADILKAPHHGSRTSSTLEWLERIAPRIVLVSCGEGNRFHHPSARTIGRYRRIGAKVFRTDREGAIRVTPTRGGAWVSTRAHPAPEWIPLGARRPPDRASPDPSRTR
jgi:competence protein ComEC